MSRDFDTLFLRGDLAHIEYHDPPPADDPQAATKQELRILNGVTSKYVYGLAWWLSGLTVYNLNQQWVWGTDWAYNQSQNTIPTLIVLFIARWTSGLLTALSVALIFVVGARAGGWRTAYVAAFIYTLTPSVLVNGRRAVFESTLLASTALLIYLAQRITGKQFTAARLLLRRALILGIAAGLVIASKHTGLLVVVATLCALIFYPLLGQGLGRAVRAGLIAVGALAVAALTFLALNVSWWSQPLAMPKIVLDQRQQVLMGQVRQTGGYASTAARVEGLIYESLLPAPQYYEARRGWLDWIGPQISGYESAGLAGLDSSFWTLVIGLLAIGGLVRGLIRWRRSGVFVVLCWITITTIGLYLLTPLEWQRYYLPVAAPVAVVCGLLFMSDRRMSVVRYAVTPKPEPVR